MDLHVTIQGQGPPLLCLHGHPGSGRSMSVFTDHLSRRFTTIAPDLRGYGRSTTRHPFDMAAHLSDLDALLQRHHIHRCLVLGWSLGGILALEWALRQPQRVNGLILVATAARPRSNHPSVSWQDLVHTAIASGLNRLIPGWRWNIDTFGRRSLYRYLLIQHTTTAYHRLAHEGLPAYLQTSRAAQRALNRALKHGYNRLPALKALTMPALVLCGAGDRHIVAEASEETAQQLPRSRFTCYPDVAHLFPWEIPDQVLTDLDSWLDHEVEWPV